MRSWQRSCVGIAVAQRPEHGRNRVHAARVEAVEPASGACRPSGLVKRNLRKSDCVARPAAVGRPHSGCPSLLSLLHPPGGHNRRLRSLRSRLACRRVASARRRGPPVRRDLVLVDEIGGREDEDLAHLSGCCWLPLIKNLRKAMVMAVATLIGSVLPALPFIFGASLACVLSSVAITIVAAG